MYHRTNLNEVPHEQIEATAGIIARYSTDRQQSCEAQINNIIQEVKRRNFPFKIVDEAIIKIEAVKGDQLIGTPEMERAVELAKAGIVQYFLVEAVDRFSRSEAVDTYYRGKLLDYGVRVLALDDGFVDPEGDGHLLTGVKKLMSQEEIRKIGFRVKRTLRDNFSKSCSIDGKEYLYTVGAAPYGFTSRPVPNCPKYLNTSVLIVDPKTSSVVREIFELHTIECLSPELIAKMFNKKGVKTFQLTGASGLWSGRTIRKMLRNEKYVGTWILGKYEHKKNRITGRKKKVPAPQDRWIVRQMEYLRIISEDLWEKTQKLLDEKSHSFHSILKKHGLNQTPAYLRHKEKRYLFSGLCRCGRCGGTMPIHTGGKDRYTRRGRKEGQIWKRKTYVKYGCQNRRRGTCEFQVRFRVDLLDKAFINLLKDKILKPEVIDRLYMDMEKRIKDLKKRAYGDIDRINQEVVSTYRELEGYRQAIAKLNTSDFIIEKLKEAEGRLKLLTEKKRRYERDMRLETIQIDRQEIKTALDNLEEVLYKNPARANKIVSSILHEKIILDADNTNIRTRFDPVKKWAIVRLKRAGLVSEREAIQSLDSDYIEFQLDIN